MDHWMMKELLPGLPQGSRHFLIFKEVRIKEYLTSIVIHSTTLLLLVVWFGSEKVRHSWCQMIHLEKYGLPFGTCLLPESLPRDAINLGALNPSLLYLNYTLYYYALQWQLSRASQCHKKTSNLCLQRILELEFLRSTSTLPLQSRLSGREESLLCSIVLVVRVSLGRLSNIDLRKQRGANQFAKANLTTVLLWACPEKRGHFLGANQAYCSFMAKN